MRLVLRIPQPESETLSPARSAPLFRTKTEGRTPAYMAIFPDLSLSFDLVERLIGAAPSAGCTDFRGVRVCKDLEQSEGGR